MPADVGLFDMLQPNVLEAMTDVELAGEIRRAVLMQDRVAEYTRLLMEILRNRMTGNGQ